MSEELVTIAGVVRTGKGKTYAKSLRKKGMIPGVIIGQGKSTSIELDPKWLHKAYKASKSFNLEMDGTAKLVKIKDVQLDPVKRVPLHVDLMYA